MPTYSNILEVRNNPLIPGEIVAQLFAVAIKTSKPEYVCESYGTDLETVGHQSFIQFNHQVGDRVIDTKRVRISRDGQQTGYYDHVVLKDYRGFSEG